MEGATEFPKQLAILIKKEEEFKSVVNLPYIIECSSVNPKMQDRTHKKQE